MSKIPGVGRKTAERLIVEMRDRIAATAPAGSPAQRSLEASPRNEAIDALVALGYKPKEVQALIAKLDIDDQSAEDIIRLALRQAAN